MGRHPSPESGMTILEVLLAAMVLSVTALVVFSAFGIGLRAAALADAMNTATGLAQEALAIVTASPCGSSFRLSVSVEPEDPRLRRYRRELLASPLRGTNLWEFIVTVSWTQERRSRSVMLKTFRYPSAACRGLGQ